jgi:hypothetical protein
MRSSTVSPVAARVRRFLHLTKLARTFIQPHRGARMAETPQDVLRRISVHVEEPEPGTFEWVLSEADASDDWQPLKRARKAARTFHAAMADGLAALEALTDDLDIGPRAPADTDTDTEPEDPPSRKRSARAAKPQRESAPKPGKRTAFGFGVLK